VASVADLRGGVDMGDGLPPPTSGPWVKKNVYIHNIEIKTFFFLLCQNQEGYTNSV